MSIRRGGANAQCLLRFRPPRPPCHTLTGAGEAASAHAEGNDERPVEVTAQVEYPQILSAYDAVAQWIGSEGRTSAGSPREVYFADWDAAGPTDEVCDIAYPVA